MRQTLTFQALSEGGEHNTLLWVFSFGLYDLKYRNKSISEIYVFGSIGPLTEYLLMGQK